MTGNLLTASPVRSRAGALSNGVLGSTRLSVPAPPDSPRAGWWFNLLSITLLGYAVFGKTWAYLGVPPIFIGEAVLLCGLPILLLPRTWRGLTRVPTFWFLMMLGIWGAFRTLPDVSVWGVDALRDAALWGYALFAPVVFAWIIARPSRLMALLSYYRRFGEFYFFVVPVVWIPCRFFGERIPQCPWADVPILHVKGDMLVHVSCILAFCVAGLGSPLGPWRLLMLAIDVVLVGTYDRGGFFAFLLVFGLCLLLRPRQRSLRWIMGVGVASLVFLAVTDLQLKMPDREREVSFRQIMVNVSSSFWHEQVGDLDDTKQWRLDWWHDILKYTVDGQYCWDGKGFGINLADDDGYQVTEDGSLRSPHNGHMTMLARGGLPGFVLWIAVQVSWVLGIVAGYVRSRRPSQRRLNGLYLFLFAFWMAWMFNATFDVCLEGPMGGIWFWTVFGVGMAVMWLHCRYPAILEDDGPVVGLGQVSMAQP